MSGMLFRKKKSNRKKTGKQGRNPVNLLGDLELLSWLSDHTEWADDYDPQTEGRKILAIHAAEQHDDQSWKVTTKRREPGGMRRVVDVEIYELPQFPSIATLERVAQTAGYGGGFFTMTNTKGKKQNHRIELSGEPEDPLADLHEAEKPVFKDGIRSTVEKAALRLLQEEPHYLKIHVPDQQATNVQDEFTKFH